MRLLWLGLKTKENKMKIRNVKYISLDDLFLDCPLAMECFEERGDWSLGDCDLSLVKFDSFKLWFERDMDTISDEYNIIEKRINELSEIENLYINIEVEEDGN